MARQHINVLNIRVNTVCAFQLCLSNFWGIEARPGGLSSLALLTLNGHADFVTGVNEKLRPSTADALHVIGRVPLDACSICIF